MNYCKWNMDEIKGLESISGIVVLYTEVNRDGSVSREIGIDKSGRVVHKFPSTAFQQGEYGIFDNQKVEISQNTPTITRTEFEKAWSE
jgi:hypothetical protein